MKENPKKLYSLKFGSIDAAKFCLSRGDFIMIAKDNDVKLVNLRDTKGDDAGDNGINAVSLLVYLWWSLL